MNNAQIADQDNQGLSGRLNAMRGFASWQLSVDFNAFMELEFDASAADLTPRHIHRLRVTARKFRASLTNFRRQFSKTDYKEMKARFKQISIWFAEIRDLDVLVEQFELLTSCSGKFCNSSILSDVQKQILVRRAERVRDIIPIASLIFAKESHDNLEAVIQQNPIINLECLKTDQEIQKFIRLTIHEKLEVLFLLERCLSDESPGAAFHQMRIALKNLRYSLEQFACLNEPLFTPWITNIQLFQDQMGLIHDLDVWNFLIDPYFELFPKQHGCEIDEESLKQAKVALKEYWLEKSRVEYDQFRLSWSALKENQFWEGIKTSLALSDELE